jgi:hypothetical protein
MTEHKTSINPRRLVFADDEEIGEVLGEITEGDVVYLHVRRFGAGQDELFIPSMAVRQVVGNHVYLTLPAEELVAQAWHVRPGEFGGASRR